MFRTLSMSRSYGVLPDLFDAPMPASFLSSTPSIDDMEERQREREKQKLLNMSIDYSSYSPISSYDKPTNFTRPNQNSAFDGLYVPYGSDVWDDPWAIKREKQEWINQNDVLPPIQPELIKTPSQSINPFATEAAPSRVFPYDAQSSQVSPSSLLSEPVSPTPSFIMSEDSSEEEDEMIQAHKRQRGEHHTVYVKQEPQDQDQYQQQVMSTMDVTPYTQPTLLSQASQGFVDYTTMADPQPFPININPYTVNHTTNININININEPFPSMTPFTLQPQQLVTLPSIPESTPVPAPSSSRRSSMYDSDAEEDVKRKRKTPSSTNKRNKSQPVATHLIENTGAPVKMAKFLHVDGLATRVWIEHAIYEENGVTTDIRLIMYQGAFNGVVVHAGDVGERIVCNRRSNISREFGQYASPQEKILVRVPSEHRPLGQTGNVLTGYGLIRFLQSKKMRKNEHQGYRRWLLYTVYAMLQSRPFTFPDGHPLQQKTVPDAPFTEDQFSH